MKLLCLSLVLCASMLGCVSKTPTTIGRIVPPEQFTTLQQTSSVVVDARCISIVKPDVAKADAKADTKADAKAADDQSQKPAAASAAAAPAPSMMQVKFEVTQVHVGNPGFTTLDVIVPDELAAQPGVMGEPFLVQGRMYRLFVPADKALGLHIGSVAQFDQFITDALGSGQRVEVQVLPQ